MKLIQLNIWQGHLLQEVLKLLDYEQPDLICLQEVYSSTINAPMFEMFNSYERIQALFPEYHGYFASTYEMQLLNKPFSFGNAILSRFPLSNLDTIFINGERRAFDSFDDYQPNTRNLQRVTVELSDTASFTLFNHHGYWDASPLGNDTTIEKMNHVAEIIQAAKGPIVFAGDLNVTPASQALKPLQSMLIDLTREYNLQTTLSEFGKVKNVACDHIFVSSDITVHSFAARTTLVSDHQALVLEFDV